MKIRKILISIIVCILILLGNQVYAALDATVTLEGVNEAKKGDMISVDVVVKINSVGEGLEAVISEIEYPESDLMLMTSDEIIVMDGTLMVALDEPVKTGEKKITLKFMVTGETEKEATIKLVDIVLTDKDKTSKEIGTKEKKIKLNGTTQQPPAEEKKLTGIEITKQPSKVEYKEGEKFNPEGMEITATYSDGSTKKVTGYDYNPKGELATTDTKITISYTDGGITKEAKQEITVKAGGTGEQPKAKLTKIEITKQPNKVDYKEGEKFNPEGMEITATYSDGSTKKVTGYKWSPSGALKTTDTKVTISYTEEGIEETVEKTIKVTKDETGTGSGDGTGAGEKYPNAGLETVIIPVIALAALAILGYVVNKRYKNI